MLNGLDLFSGIGGLSIALAPWVRPVAYCEKDRYAQAVLLSRMADNDIPRAPIWDDITSLRGPMLPNDTDIIYGGFPCQDVSLAGDQIGLVGERSGLFFEIMRLAEELKPTFIFLENVPGIRKHLGRIGWELSSIGYDCRWDFISAKEIGAPHLRKRWFCLAYLPDPNGQRLSIARRYEKQVKVENRNEFKFLVQEDIWSESACDFSRMDDGIPPRTHRIKSCGNAVVPQQAREAFKRLMGLKD